MAPSAGEDAIVGASRPAETNGDRDGHATAVRTGRRLASLRVEERSRISETSLSWKRACTSSDVGGRTGVAGGRWLTILRRDERARRSWPGSTAGRGATASTSRASGSARISAARAGERASCARRRRRRRPAAAPAGTSLDAGLPGPELLPEAGLPGDRRRRGVPGGSHHHPPATRSRFGPSHAGPGDSEGRAVSGEPSEAFFGAHYVLTYAPLQPDDRSRAEALAAAPSWRDSHRGARASSTCRAGTAATRCRSPAEGYRVVGLDRSRLAARRGAAPARHGDRAAPDPRGLPSDPHRRRYLRRGADPPQLAGVRRRGCGPERAPRDPASPAPGRPPRHRDEPPRPAASRTPWREWYPLGDGAVLLAESRVDRIAGTVELVHTYRPATGPAETRTIRWRAYSATELVRILADAGFGEIACYGNLDGGAFGADTRLVLVATAPAMA